MKENALGEIYNFDPKDTKQRNTGQQTLRKAIQMPGEYTADQQVMILCLLRFRVLSHQHFKVVFGEQSMKQDVQQEALITEVDYCQMDEGKFAVELSSNPSKKSGVSLFDDFLDVHNEVAFVNEIESNENLAKISPAFSQLEEFYKLICQVQKQIKTLEGKKSSVYFRRRCVLKNIKLSKVDKVEIEEVIGEINTNIHEIQDRKKELLSKRRNTERPNGKKEEEVKDDGLYVSDYLVGKVQYTEKKSNQIINSLNYIKLKAKEYDPSLASTRQFSQQQSVTSNRDVQIVSDHILQTMHSRSVIESDFLKRRIHFISDMRFPDRDWNAGNHTMATARAITTYQQETYNSPHKT